MDRITRRPNHIEDVLSEMYAGDGKGMWFGWSDPMNKIYENIIIHDPAKEKPVKDFLEAELVRLQSEFDSQDYARNRATAYASTGDQLDMQYWDSVNDTTTWKDHVASVKAQFPKP